jgi:nucleoside-diphosphate-sugar epimerase
VTEASQKKLVVAGASGNVGAAVIRHFAARAEWDVIGVSRRRPTNLDPFIASRLTHLPVDLTDREQCDAALGSLSDVTHVVYAALYEDPADVVKGWRSQEQIETNGAMFANFFSPLESSSQVLEHVSLMQGTKAYGIHVLWPEKWFSIPARESEPRHAHENFYWLQEDYLRDRQKGKRWSWTIWRPQLMFSDSVGSNLSTLAVIAAYGVLEREAGRGMSYPGGPAYPLEATDVDLLADAIDWATTAAMSHNEVFNVTNGDVFVWENVWPVIASALGVSVAPPKARSMAGLMSSRGAEWAALVDRYDLVAPRSLSEFIGGSAALVDQTFADGCVQAPPPNIESTIKIRQAGFGECIDTEAMLGKWIARLQESRLIPPR